MCNKHGGKESTYRRWSIIDNNTFWGGGRRVEAERPSSCVYANRTSGSFGEGI